MFRFTTSSGDPTARVRCLSCPWEATGDDPRVVFPQADQHVCVTIDWRDRCGFEGDDT